MSLKNLLFRCPDCGHEPVDGDGDTVSCAACGRRYERGGPGACIRVRDPAGTVASCSAAQLVEAIGAHGGALSAALKEGGELDYRARARMRLVEEESPVYFSGRLLGFFERLGHDREGVLRLSTDTLAFSGPDGATLEWCLLDITALQTSSSSVQISPKGGAVAQFRFVDDSPRRWEELLQYALSEAWVRAGIGVIVDFQPRIATR